MFSTKVIRNKGEVRGLCSPSQGTSSSVIFDRYNPDRTSLRQLVQPPCLFASLGASIQSFSRARSPTSTFNFRAWNRQAYATRHHRQHTQQLYACMRHRQQQPSATSSRGSFYSASGGSEHQADLGTPWHASKRIYSQKPTL